MSNYQVLQSVGSQSGSVGASATFGSNLSAGTKLIAECVIGTTGSTLSFADGSGHSFVALISSSTLFTRGLFVFDTVASMVGTKPTLTVSGSGVAFGNAFVCAEVAGLAPGTTTAACLDGTAGQASASNSGNFTPTWGAYTSSAPGELLVAAYGDGGDAGSTASPQGSPWTALTGNQNGNSASNALIVFKDSTGGTESASWGTTVSGANNWGTILVAFMLAGSPSIVPQQARARFRQRRSTRQLARQQPWLLSMDTASAVTVNLTTAQVNISAPAPSLRDQLALSVAQVNIAAPAPSPRVQLSLPVAQVNINALAPTIQVRESLSVAQVNINALAPTIQTRPSLTTAQVNINALAPSVRASVNLPVAQVNINALPLSIGANVNVNLTTAQVNVSARAPSLQDSLTLARAQVNVAALPPSPRVQLSLTTAQVSVNARAASPQSSLSLSVAQVSISARVPSPSLSLTLAVAQATVAALAVAVSVGNAQPLGPATGGTVTAPQPAGATTAPQPGGTASAGASGGSVTSPAPGGTIT